MSRVIFNMRIVQSSTVSTSGNQKDLATPKVPRGLRSLPVASGLPQSSPSGDMSDLQQDVAAIERWWMEPRWKHTKRTYSGECLSVGYSSESNPV